MANQSIPTLPSTIALAGDEQLELVQPGGSSGTSKKVTIGQITSYVLDATPSASGAVYGSFYDTSTQTLSSAIISQLVTINSSYGYNGVGLDSNKIYFYISGVYNITFSVQFANYNNGVQGADLWLKLNGNDIAYSDSRFDLPREKSGTPSYTIGTVNFLLSLNANDYLELWWHGSLAGASGVKILPIAAGSGPDHPAVPSVIFTAFRI